MKKISNPILLTLAALGLFTGTSSLFANDWPPTLSMRMFDDWPWSARTEVVTAVPAINVSETSKEYTVRAELPGMRKEDVNITFDGGMLTISGERKQSKDEKDASYRMQESAYGAFSRSISLPRDADPAQAKAEFKDGELIITMAKNPALQPKKIMIR